MAATASPAAVTRTTSRRRLRRRSRKHLATHHAVVVRRPALAFRARRRIRSAHFATRLKRGRGRSGKRKAGQMVAPTNIGCAPKQSLVSGIVDGGEETSAV